MGSIYFRCSYGFAHHQRFAELLHPAFQGQVTDAEMRLVLKEENERDDRNNEPKEHVGWGESALRQCIKEQHS